MNIVKVIHRYYKTYAVSDIQYQNRQSFLPNRAMSWIIFLPIRAASMTRTSLQHYETYAVIDVFVVSNIKINQQSFLLIRACLSPRHVFYYGILID